MVLPKYNFYAGIAFTEINFTRGQDIDSNGNYVESYNESYASDKIEVSSEKIFINTGATYRIAFYDDNDNFIGVFLRNSLGIYSIPENAKFFAVSFSLNTADANLNDIPDFIYGIKQITPHYKSLSKKYSKENQQEFFREELEGKISLFGKDYGLIAASSLEDKFIFIVDKLGESKVYYTGLFTKSDCVFDFDKQKCELKLKPYDSYSRILGAYENTYDLVKLAPEITQINMAVRPVLQIYVRGSKTVSNFYSGTYWEQEVDAVEDILKLDKYHFGRSFVTNEVYVKGSSLEEINGIYTGAGNNWKNGKGFSMDTEQYYEEIDGEIVYFNTYWIYIRRDSDGKAVYKSDRPTPLNNNTGADVTLPPGITKTFTAIENNGVAEGTCEIDASFEFDIWARMLSNTDTVSDSQGIKNTYALPLEDFAYSGSVYKKCSPVSGLSFYTTTASSDTPSRYGKNDYGKYFIKPPHVYSTLFPISRNSWANMSIWLEESYQYSLIESSARKKLTLKDSYSIAAVIKVLLNKIDPSIRHEENKEFSRFLYDKNMPLGENRFYVFITQKTNVLKGNYDQPAQKAETSLKNIMDMLCKCFKCYWYIENNMLKIEHISFFLNGGSYEITPKIQLDLVKKTDKFNKKPALYFQSGIEYEKSDLNNRYEFTWVDNATSVFNINIDVNSNYVEDKKEEISPSQFSSDVDYMFLNPSNFSNDGFVLLCPEIKESGLELPIVTVDLLDEDRHTYQATVQNWYASWVYLARFYMYDMPAYSINNSMVQELFVQSIKYSMEHKIEFMSENDPSLFELINTRIGAGKIRDMSIDLDTRHITVTLQYRPK